MSFQFGIKTTCDKLSTYPRDLNYSLSPSVDLRVTRRTKVQTDIHGFVQPRNKFGPSTKHNPLGQSM
jgi:hypothetical protein